MQILGIVNLTRDSFSDGGRYLDPRAALARARQLLADGADFVDLGAQATHPEAEEVSADEEIARLTPVVTALKAEGARVSIDTYRAAVVRAMLALGADIINDVTGLRDPECVAAVHSSAARIILMHSVASGARAERVDVAPEEIVDRILEFFRTRVRALTAAGIDADRLILDPGMGLFLGSDPRASLVVLRELRQLHGLGLPLCICTSRKSVIGRVLAGPHGIPPTAARGAGTLASELWAAAAGVSYIRTHDVRALCDGVRVWRAIEGARAAGPEPTAVARDGAK